MDGIKDGRSEEEEVGSFERMRIETRVKSVGLEVRKVNSSGQDGGCNGGKVKYVNDMYDVVHVYGGAHSGECMDATRKIAITVEREHSKRDGAASRGAWTHKLMLELICDSSYLKPVHWSFSF